MLGDLHQRLAPGGRFHCKLNTGPDYVNAEPELVKLWNTHPGFHAKFTDAKNFTLTKTD